MKKIEEMRTNGAHGILLFYENVNRTTSNKKSVHVITFRKLKDIYFKNKNQQNFVNFSNNNIAFRKQLRLMF